MSIVAVRKSSYEYIIPAALALVISLVLIRFISVFTTEYILKVLDSQMIPPESYRYYFDLDGDGHSEIFSIYYNAAGNLAISVSNMDQSTINQFNLPGRLTTLGPIVDLHDINSDGILDIFICTIKNDSLYLGIIDDLYGHPTTTKEYFLDRVNQYNGNGDYLFVAGETTDLNRDGNPEYVMAINGGYSLQPRRVYAIDYYNDHVSRSPVSGATVVSLDCFDLDGDGTDEILLNTVAPENFKQHIPFRDSITWLMILDEDLTFYRPPIAFNEPPASLSMEPFIHEGIPYIMVYHRYRKEEDYNADLTIYSNQLVPVKKRLFKGHLQSRYYLWRIPDSLGIDDLKLMSNGAIFSVDFDLRITDSIMNRVPFGYNDEVLLDLDADGTKEVVFTGNFTVNVFRADLRESAQADIVWSVRNPRTLISVIEQGDNYPVLFVQAETDEYYLSYRINEWFRYRVIVYPGLFLILFGLFFLWGMIQNRIVSVRFEKDRLIRQLQLQSIRNQMDPHFTYNALNAVGSLIYKGEKDQAYQYLKGLSDLLRMVTGDADEVTWSLSAELEFVHKYLSIEKLRFREKFSYEVNVEEKLGGVMVPKMSVLSFVENAIKHGLRHKEYNRRLSITAEGVKSGIKIEIRDNGIGRTAAAKYQTESTGNGIEMMKQYFRQFSEVTGKRAQFEIRDQFEYDLKPAGTLVKIYIS
jgi:hypothetical protein